jgi:glucose/arabinose dehydrogenase
VKTHTRSVAPGEANRLPIALTIAILLATTTVALVLSGCSSNAPLTSDTYNPPQSADAASTQPLGPANASQTAGGVSLAHLSLSLVRRWSGLSAPLYLTNAGDGSKRIFIVEQTGRIRVVADGALQSSPYLDLHTRISYGGERGLLGLAFSPNFATDGRVYVNYTDTSGNTMVARYTANPPSSSSPTWSTPTTLLHITQPYPNHNGGCLQFGPDGYLYIGTGDGGSEGDPGNRGQNRKILLGKILRIDPSKPSGSKPYSIPPTNPARMTTGAALKPPPEVWSIGMRNPWRFSFDPATKAMWIADVGQNTWEEIDHVTPAQATARASKGGLNFGWRLYEGLHYYPSLATVPVSKRSSSFVWPVFDYKHPYGESITGGYVYRGSAFPALIGTYVFADYVKGWVAGLRLTAPDGTVLAKPEERTLLTTSYNPSSFGVDEDNELYLVDLQGAVYQVTATSK